MIRRAIFGIVGGLLVCSGASCGPLPAAGPVSAESTPAAPGATTVAPKESDGGAAPASEGTTAAEQPKPAREAAPDPPWVPMATSAQTVGGLSQEQAIKQGAGKIEALGKACHSHVRERTELDVGLSLEDDGSIETVDVVGALDEKSLPLAKCIKTEAKSWSFSGVDGRSNLLLRIAWVERAEAEAQQQMQQALARQGRDAAVQCHAHIDPKHGEIRIWARLLIRAKGTVEKVQLQTRNKPLAKCLEKAMKTWTFPAGADQRGIAVPLVLKPQ